MSELIKVTYLDGSTDIVTIEEAKAARQAGQLAPAPEDNKALTLKDFFGEGYDERYTGR